MVALFICTMKEFSIYGLKVRNTEQYLYVGYVRSGSTKGILSARCFFEDELDLVGTNFEDISTDNFDEAIALCNLYRMKYGLLVSRNRMKFDIQIDDSSAHFDFELPALDPKRAEDRALSRYKRAHKDTSTSIHLEPVQKGVKRKQATFKAEHSIDDKNGYVRYVPILREGYPTLKVELINPTF